MKLSFTTIILTTRVLYLFSDVKTIIIGSGMTGAMAAKTLHEAGETDFLILEASSRVGGRVWNVPFGGETTEIGATWFHGGLGNPVWERARDLGMSYRISRYFNLAARDEDGTDVTEEMEAIFERFDPILEAAEDYCKVMQCEDVNKTDTSFRRLVFQYGWKPRTSLEWVADLFNIEFEIGQYADGASARHYYEWLHDDFVIPSDYLCTDPRGYSYVIQSFLDDILEEDDDRLRLGIRATSINQNETHVTVETSSGETFSSEFLLSTVSLGVLQQGAIAWDPPFSQEKFEAIMQHQIGLYITTYLKFDEDIEPFWDDAEWILYADSRPRYWPVFQNMNEAYPGSNLLQVTVTGEEAERIEQLSNAAIEEEIMGVLRNMYGPDIPEPISILVPKWSGLSNFHGSYSDWPTAYDLNMNHQLRLPHRRVHFAGEAMSSRYFGYVHGAYYEGIRGAEFLMECMEDEDCELSMADECTDGITRGNGRSVARHRRGMETK